MNKMIKSKKPLKALALSLGLAALLLPATNLNAQSKHGGLFGKSSRNEATQNGMMQKSGGSTISDEGGPFTNANFGEEVPIAGGVAVLLAAGLGYVALKKRKEDEQ